MRPEFSYAAEVINRFPQIASAGVSWRVQPRLRLAFQLDWLGWSDAFDKLRIKLTQGNNADLNALVGSNSAEDFVPLGWQDRFVYRTGVEYSVNGNVRLRAGYSYGKSPVPDETLTPLTAAILEHSVSTGVGWESGRYQFNLGYQYDLPIERKIGASQLRSGEYSHSLTEAGIHWVGISAAIKF